MTELKDYKFIENPVVGKYYRVPCVRSPFDKRKWLPVMPHLHTDKQFTGGERDKAHYHFDLRFVRPRDLKQIRDLQLKDIPRTGRVAWKNQVEEIRFLRRKCHSASAGLARAQHVPMKAQIWYREMVGKSCAGAVCPHYRVPMFTRADGRLECPYHGLIGDPATEKIIGNIHEEKL